MKNRPMPVLEEDDLGLGGPVARGGVSPRGSMIAPAILLLALAALAGFTFDLWRILPEPRLVALRRIAYGVWLGVQWLVLFGAAFYFALATGMLYENRRIHLVASRQARVTMFRLTLLSQPRQTVVTAWRRWILFGSAAILASWWLASIRPLAFVVLTVAFLTFAGVRSSTPPAVVLLGTSDAADLKWHRTLLFRARPLRVVSCLDITNAQAPVGAWNLTLDCFRSSPGQDWWRTVQELVQLTPFVVIDGTVATPDLEREVRSLLATEQAWKCLVLHGPEGECELLDAVGAPQGSFCTVSTEAGVSVVTHLLAQGELPSAGRPVAALLP
jgi:hypothetical protein